MVGNKKFFLLQPVEFWKMPSRGRNISEYEIIQHTQITINLGYGTEIDRLILVR